MAVRIRARAIKRCGELLRPLQRPEHSGRPGNKMGSAAAPFPNARPRTVRASQSGRRSKPSASPTCRKLNSSSLVESDDPPTVSRLADLGKKSRPQPFVFDWRVATLRISSSPLKYRANCGKWQSSWSEHRYSARSPVRLIESVPKC